MQFTSIPSWKIIGYLSFGLYPVLSVVGLFVFRDAIGMLMLILWPITLLVWVGHLAFFFAIGIRNTTMLNVFGAEYVDTLLKGIPNFYDPNLFPWWSELEADWREILDECHAYQAKHRELPSAYDNAVMSTGDFWTAGNLVSWGYAHETDCPKTLQWMKKVGALTCNFSRLDAHTKIEPHFGENTAYVRFHLGLDVPDGDPAGQIHVGKQSRSWKNGRLLAFCDGYQHWAENPTDRPRVVLIFDCMHPRYAGLKSWLCAYYLLCYTMFGLATIADNLFSIQLLGELKLHGTGDQRPLLTGYARICWIILMIPLSPIIWLYYRCFCRKIPQWMREVGTGFYF